MHERVSTFQHKTYSILESCSNYDLEINILGDRIIYISGLLDYRHSTLRMADEAH